MIKIQKSETADTRSCDFKNVTKDQLIKSSKQHIKDVQLGIEYFKDMLTDVGKLHDFDKLSNIDVFHKDFINGFRKTEWWDEHRKVNRHHFSDPKDIPENVNLIDVLEMIIDCVMAGKARTGTVYPIVISNDLLQKAFQNTVDKLKNEVIVE